MPISGDPARGCPDGSQRIPLDFCLTTPVYIAYCATTNMNSGACVIRFFINK